MAHKQKFGSYVVDVVGYTWEGFKSTYTYQMTFAPTSAAEVKPVAGDFQSIEDFRVSTTTRITRATKDGTSTKIDHRVVRDWEQPSSEMIFTNAQA